MTRTVFVTLTYSDVNRLSEVAEACHRLGAEYACLQGEGPGLDWVLDHLVAEGERDFHLVPVTFEVGVPASWAGRVARYWLERQPEPRPAISFIPEPLHRLPEPGDPIPAGRQLRPKDTLTNPSWERVPAVGTHLLACRGPRCAAKGSAAVIAALGSELAARGMLDTGVLVTQTGCVYPCNHAPVIVVHPLGEWFGPIQLSDVPAVVEAIANSDWDALPRIERK